MIMLIAVLLFGGWTLVGDRFGSTSCALAADPEGSRPAPPTLDETLRDMQRRMDEWRSTKGWGLPDDDFFRSPFEKQFEDLLKQFRLATPFGSRVPTLMEGTLKTDIVERDGQLIITIDLPGQSKEAIDLRIKDNALVLTSERKQQYKESDDKQKVYRSEISYGSQRRVIQLPRKVLEDRVTARYENGTLIVTAPIDQTTPAPDDDGRRITIQ
jgi:HSP20 family protein